MPAVASRLTENDRTAEGIAVTSLILEIFRTNGRLLRIGDQLAADLGITSTRWQVLGAIGDRPRTVAQIAREYEMTRQGALWVVQALLKDELVELIHNPDHKRAKLVRLTAQGATVLARVLDRQHRWADDLGRLFTLDELRSGEAIIRRLGALIAVERGQPD